MITDQKLIVSFTKGDIVIFHKSQMGDLKQLFNMGNAYRYEEGLPSISLQNWLQRSDVKDYISYLENKTGSEVIKKTRGKGATTLAHLKILLDAAVALSPQLKDEVYTSFIEDKLLILRDDGGDYFKDLNYTLSLYAQSVLGKDAHQGHFINLAKIIKKRLGVIGWNTASAYQLRERSRIESVLSTMLRTGVVRDWDHLKELAKIV